MRARILTVLDVVLDTECLSFLVHTSRNVDAVPYIQQVKSTYTKTRSIHCAHDAQLSVSPP
jgi:hypothetical protein